MKIPRIRFLRHWSRAKTDMRGHWLLIIEPRWPIFRFWYDEGLSDFRGFLPTKEDDSLDIIIEQFDRTKFSGDCKETIWAVDLFEFVALWAKI